MSGSDSISWAAAMSPCASWYWLVQRDQRAEFGVLAGHLAVVVHVRGGAFGHQQFVEFDQAVGQLVQLGQHGWFHSVSLRGKGRRAAAEGRAQRGGDAGRGR
jgi:hypothetical protein